jgi:ribosomal-protein-alanine N-acetyltransferase
LNPDRIRRAERADVDAILAIARDEITDPWSKASIEEEIARDNGEVLVAVEDARIVGFAIAWFVADEATLLLIAVASNERRRGLAGALLDRVVVSSRARGAKAMHLEVRASNEGARAFYRACGFSEVGVRARYYGGVEDAVLMTRRIDVELVILAGGRGERMGGVVKPLLRREDGRTILEGIDRALSPLCARTLLVAPADLLPVLDPEARFVDVADEGEGPARALMTAAAAARAEWLFVVAGDQPRMSAALWARLAGETTRDAVDAVVAEVDGRRQPLGALYRRAALVALSELPTSLQGMLDRLRTRVVDALALGAEECAAFEDADTPADATRLSLKP